MSYFKQTLFFFILFVFVSCSKDSDTLVDIPQPSTDFYAFINARVSGTQINTEIPSTGIPNYQATIGYLQKDDVSGNCENYNYNAGVSPISNSGLPSFKVGFIGFLDETIQSCSDELSVFETLFEVDSYDYALTAQGNGVNIKHTNTNTTYSSFGMQDASANFNITGIEIKDCGVKKCINVIGTFNVRLYDVNDPNEFIDVTEGRFKVRVQSFN